MMLVLAPPKNDRIRLHSPPLISIYDRYQLSKVIIVGGFERGVWIDADAQTRTMITFLRRALTRPCCRVAAHYNASRPCHAQPVVRLVDFLI